MRSIWRISALNMSTPAPYLGSNCNDTRVACSSARPADLDQLIAHAPSRHLDLAGALHRPQVRKRLRQRLAPGEQPVVAQDQDRLAAHGREHARAFLGVDGDALEVVVGDFPIKLGGIEIRHRQPALGAGHRQPGGGVRVHHAMRPVDLAVHGGMRRQARRIDRPLAVGEDVAVEIDLDEVGGGDLGVVQAERVDQQVLLRARHAQGDVIVDHLGPAEVGEDAVAGGELDARPPLLGRHALQLRSAMVDHDLGDAHCDPPEVPILGVILARLIRPSRCAHRQLDRLCDPRACPEDPSIHWCWSTRKGGWSGQARP